MPQVLPAVIEGTALSWHPSSITPLRPHYMRLGSTRVLKAATFPGMFSMKGILGFMGMLLHFLSPLFAPSTLFAAKPPNIVLIISDDQAWTDYGFMGHKHIQTPYLDKLSDESILFRRGYVPTALCRPSLLSLVTGHYAHRHEVTGNDPSPKYAERNSELYNQRRAQLISYIEKFETLPELLSERGYLSHQSGKWWEGKYSHGGFTHGMTRGFPEPGGRHGDDGLAIGRKGMKPIADFVQMATDKGKPFFIWYGVFLPHTPHNPPDHLFRKYKGKVASPHVERYYAMCEWFDETCGQLIDIIDQNGVRENTLTVYVTDNGWIQHPDRHGYDARSKQTPYEGGIRTPIMFHWPGKLKPADRPELVSSIDLFPTMLAAAGARIPDDVPGLNLLPNLTTGKEIDRKHILGEGFAHDIADIEKPEASLLYRWTIQDKWKLLLTYDGEVNRYKTTHPRTERRPQLFDLMADPTEERNLAGQYPEVVARLAENIASWYPVRDRRVKVKFE
ncbi:MAG: Arylsulfatase [Verrucomicrobia subdivision 3 bacterium]|nr:Arylsulfatase [Limisphaerales bacterium]MCS1412899.1 Arylsulfatase [Limisphaerales bacterium]